MSIFVTADLHFNHANIIGYCHRPWAAVAAMNADLVRNWNQVVGPRDDVYVLGDFAYTHRDGWPVEGVFAQLHGRKRLIVGNHDERNPAVLKLPWVAVERLMTLRHGGLRFELCHYPLETWKSAQRGYLHLHGHSHGTLKRVIPHRFDVGVDAGWLFRPVALERLAALAAMQAFAAQDHHGD